MLFFLCWALCCTALAGMSYFQSWIGYNKLPHNFLASLQLVEQCLADSFSNGSESEKCRGWLILSLNYEKNLNSLKKIYRAVLKLFIILVKVDRNVCKTANKSAIIHTNQILLCSNWPELSPWPIKRFLKRLKLLSGDIACQKRFVFFRWRPNIKIFLFLPYF